MTTFYLEEEDSWESQPQEIVELDESHPLASGLVEALDLTQMRHVIPGTPLAVTGAPKIRPYSEVLGRAFGTTLGGGATDSVDNDVSYSTNHTLVLVCMRLGVGGNNAGRILEGNGSGSLNTALIANAGAGYNSYFRGSDTTQGIWTTTGGMGLGTLYVHGISQKGLNAPLWFINGVKQTISVFQSPSGAAYTGTITASLGNRTARDRVYDGLILFRLRYSRDLSEAELCELTTNFWQLFKKFDWSTFATGTPSGTTYTFSVSGSVTFSGAIPFQRIRTLAVSGALAFSGSSSLAVSHTFRPTVSGSILFSGTAPFSSSAQYQFSPSGSVNFSGTSALLKTRVLVPAGQVTFSGSAGIIFIPAGGIPSTDNRYITIGAGRSMRIS